MSNKSHEFDVKEEESEKIVDNIKDLDAFEKEEVEKESSSPFFGEFINTLGTKLYNILTNNSTVETDITVKDGIRNMALVGYRREEIYNSFDLEKEIIDEVLDDMEEIK